MKQEYRRLAALRQQEARALERDRFCIDLVQRCTDLIDELQRERGLGQLVLSTAAESYAPALCEQIQCSVEVEQALRQPLRQLEQAPRNAETELTGLKRLGLAMLHSPGLADLVSLRRDLLLTRCSRQAVYDAYCTLLAQLLELVEAAGHALSDSALKQELAILLQLMWGKEYSGQERASGAGLYASGRHAARGWQRIGQLIEAQQRCASAFISRARPGARKRLKDSLRFETQIELEALRQQLADSPDQATLDPGLGELWFRSCSRRMNELREVERHLLQEMQQALARRQAHPVTTRPPAEMAQTARLTPGAVETVLRTAAAWLAGASAGATPRRGTPA
ncbi:nitrate- and nitrite sensing domain-containing protein [Malikia sp.]|uniref:nitrate- and nitrite sensing domain-containing protein n=1 Tax=Malikia sp. TaxID=2070706 RepID=UPI00262639BD|nr:nitrate- and nitrite sensing domain-containing protein [Malikia sp.]MDD2728852.1 nitrate- and nitrite sensing domain-containing protein [Malikia sp.]